MPAPTRRRSLAGLTLPELVVIVMVVGTLAAAAIPLYTGQQRAVKDAATEGDTLELSTAIRIEMESGDIPWVETDEGWFLLNGIPAFEASPGVELVDFAASSTTDWCVQLTHPEGDRARSPGIRYDATIDEVEAGNCE